MVEFGVLPMAEPAVISQPHAAMVPIGFDVVMSPKQHTYFWGCMCFKKSRTEHPKPLFLLCGWVDLGVGMGVVLTAT